MALAYQVLGGSNRRVRFSGSHIVVREGMKTETQTKCKCKGALFSVQGSRIDEAFGHRIYECDKCHERWKFIDREYEVQVFDGFSNRKHRIKADNYDEAIWKSGISAHPAGYISSVHLVNK